MQKIIWPGNEQWPQWQKILFRFFFLYFIIYQNPWTLIYNIRGLEFIANYYGQFAEWGVNFANDHLFHFYKVLIPENGSGDTSFAWTELCVALLLALIGCAVWTLIDARRNNYNRIAYWLRIIVRYFVIFIC